MKSFKLGQTSKRRCKGIDPRWFEVIDLALGITLIDFGIPKDGGFRTMDRQHAMFLDPTIVTGCDGINDISKHQSGLALDFFAYIDGRASWDHESLTHIAAAFLQAAASLGFKIRWGGFFHPDGWDKCHLEFID